jgi:hypothetical protein
MLTPCKAFIPPIVHRDSNNSDFMQACYNFDGDKTNNVTDGFLRTDLYIGKYESNLVQATKNA